MLVATFHAQNASWKPHKEFLYTAVIFLISREKHCLLLHIIVCACPRKSFDKVQKMSSCIGKNHSLQVPKTFCALRTKRFLREELSFCWHSANMLFCNWSKLIVARLTFYKLSTLKQLASKKRCDDHILAKYKKANVKKATKIKFFSQKSFSA